MIAARKRYFMIERDITAFDESTGIATFKDEGETKSVQTKRWTFDDESMLLVRKPDGSYREAATTEIEDEESSRIVATFVMSGIFALLCGAFVACVVFAVAGFFLHLWWQVAILAVVTTIPTIWIAFNKMGKKISSEAPDEFKKEVRGKGVPIRV